VSRRGVLLGGGRSGRQGGGGRKSTYEENSVGVPSSSVSPGKKVFRDTTRGGGPHMGVFRGRDRGGLRGGSHYGFRFYGMWGVVTQGGG